MFFKIALLKKFAIFTGKTPQLESLFNKDAGFYACNFIKKETPTQMFSCEQCKIFKNSLFIELIWWLLRLTLKFIVLNFYLVLNFLLNYSICGVGNVVMKCYNQ